MESDVKKIYLTFDDGPIPDVTPWVLDLLDSYQAKASFFCIGQNVEKNPIIFQEVISRGHTVGNHTYTHPSGWKSSKKEYLREIEKASRYIKSSFFRPPFGKITLGQYQAIKNKIKVVMWDIISFDFDTTISKEKCLNNVIDHARPGSIIVFHDSQKAWPNLEYALPRTMKYLSEAGYTFHRLEEEI